MLYAPTYLHCTYDMLVECGMAGKRGEGEIVLGLLDQEHPVAAKTQQLSTEDVRNILCLPFAVFSTSAFPGFRTPNSWCANPEDSVGQSHGANPPR